MKDQLGRDITYLRISITDLCNLRCIYCMPNDGGCDALYSDVMSREEIVEMARAAVDLGIYKIRITGGEPLIRADVVDICRDITSIPGVKELAITTNGLLLEKLAKPLAQAGVSRLNISLDTLQTDKYKRLTRRGNYADVIAGIRAAEEVGLTPIKINTVLIGGVNDDEIKDFVELTRNSDIEVRFIELMPIGECVNFPKETFIKGSTVLERVPELQEAENSGVARMYRLPEGKGKVGLIAPVNQHFCLTCNRIRLTCDGKLKPCLHSKDEINLRGLHGEELRETIRAGILGKPAQHVDLTYGFQSETSRYMNQIGG